MKIQEIREALQDRRIPIVAQATGIHHNTITKIRDGETKDPSHRVIEALSAYLARGEA